MFRRLTAAFDRYPLTVVFLLAAAVFQALEIGTEHDYSLFVLTFVVGALLGAVAQAAYERFLTRFSARLLLMGISVLLAVGYYLTIQSAPSFGVELGTKTAIALFALFIAYIWVPVINSKISFNPSFMIAFKASFLSLFFSGVIFGGMAAIIGAADLLLFSVNNDVYMYLADIVFIVFAPMHFLSLIPLFPGKANPDAQENNVDQAASCPKFLEVLISYIFIPLIAGFTLIMLIYILVNIGGKFWTNNLLEPMIISYSVTVLLVYLLASQLTNVFAAYYRKIAPKVLVPVVIFQIISSIISLGDTGITHTRYFVILFGAFAAVSGILLSFLPLRKNGAIAGLLLIFAFISIVPPVDAFTISRNNQIATLERVLTKNNMLKNNAIAPNSSISEKDKEIITRAMEYLSNMEYTRGVKWLPDAYNPGDFRSTFGFDAYYGPENVFNPPIYLIIERQAPIDVSGYDVVVPVDIYMSEANNEKISDLVLSGRSYSLRKEKTQDRVDLVLVGNGGEEILRFGMEEIIDKYSVYDASKNILAVDDATFLKENDLANFKIVVQSANIERENKMYSGASLYVFVKIK
jgi:hypothetical protein